MIDFKYLNQSFQDIDYPTLGQGDIGKTAYRIDRQEVFRLKSLKPLIWEPLSEDIEKLIYFMGDSTTRFGYDDVYKGAETTNYQGVSGILLGCGYAATETTGTLLYRAEDKAFQWTIAGDTEGAWYPISQAGRYTFESGTPNKWLNLWVRSFDTLPTSDKTISVTLSGQYQTRVNWSTQPGALANVYAHFRLRHNVHGAPGAKTSEFKELMPYLVSQITKRGVIVIRMGTNDVSNNVTAETALENAYSCFDTLRATGCKLVICGVAARWSSTGIGTPVTTTQRDILFAINKGYKAYAEAHATDCEYVDQFSLTAHTDYTDGRPADNMLIDYVHDGYLGAKIIGEAMSKAIERWIKPDGYPVRGDTAILNSTGWMIGTTGTNAAGSSGTVPTGWTVTSSNASEVTAVNSVLATTDHQGKILQSAVTFNTTATRTVNLAQTSITAPENLKGKKIYFEVDIELDTTNTAVTVNPYIFVNRSGGQQGIRSDYYVVRTDEPKHRTSVFVDIPLDATTIAPAFQITISGVANGTATVRVSEYLIREY